MVKHNQNGLFVKARNSQKIAEACNKLLENVELRKRLGEEARKTVEEKFTWKLIAKKFDRLYKKLYPNGKNHKNGKNSKNHKNHKRHKNKKSKKK